MIIDTKNKELIIGVKRIERYKLSNKRLRLLMLLSDNEAHTFEEINLYCKTVSEITVKHLVYNIKKEIPGLHFKTIVKVGYRLDDNIFIK